MIGSTYSTQYAGVTVIGSTYSTQYTGVTVIGSTYSTQYTGVTVIGSTYSTQYAGVTVIGSTYLTQYTGVTVIGSTYLTQYKVQCMLHMRSCSVPPCLKDSLTVDRQSNLFGLHGAFNVPGLCTLFDVHFNLHVVHGLSPSAP